MATSMEQRNSAEPTVVGLFFGSPRGDLLIRSMASELPTQMGAALLVAWCSTRAVYFSAQRLEEVAVFMEPSSASMRGLRPFVSLLPGSGKVGSKVTILGT